MVAREHRPKGLYIKATVTFDHGEPETCRVNLEDYGNDFAKALSVAKKFVTEWLGTRHMKGYKIESSTGKILALGQ